MPENLPTPDEGQIIDKIAGGAVSPKLALVGAVVGLRGLEIVSTITFENTVSI